MQYNPKLGILENVKRLYRERNTVSARCDNTDARMLLTCQETTVSDEWDETKIYEEGDYVIYDSHLYRCLIANYGVHPTDIRYWLHTSIVNELNYLNDRKVDK